MDIRQEIKEEGIQEGMQKGLQAGRQEGLQTGRQEGLQAGMQKGMQTGMQKEKQQVALNMLKNRLDIPLISKVTGLSEDQINRLKNGS